MSFIVCLSACSKPVAKVACKWIPDVVAGRNWSGWNARSSTGGTWDMQKQQHKTKTGDVRFVRCKRGGVEVKNARREERDRQRQLASASFSTAS